jgi:hypothetical protein
MQHNHKPSKVDNIAEQRQQAELKQQEHIQNCLLAFSDVFKGSNGEFVAGVLFNMTNAESPSYEPLAMAKEKALRDLWKQLRGYIPKETLIKVEISK